MPTGRVTVERLPTVADAPELQAPFPEASDRSRPIAIGAPEARPLFKVRPEGGLEVASRGTVFVRKGCVAWYSGKIRFAPLPEFRNTSLERILRATGPELCSSSTPGAAPTAAT